MRRLGVALLVFVCTLSMQAKETLATLHDKSNRMIHAEWIRMVLSEQDALLKSTPAAQWLDEIEKDAKEKNKIKRDSTAMLCLPTMYDLVMYEYIQRGWSYHANTDSLRQAWKAFHQTPKKGKWYDETLPLLYVDILHTSRHGQRVRAFYEEQPDSWERGLILSEYGYDESLYDLYKTYLNANPNSPFAAPIRYKKAQAEQINVQAYLPSLALTTDSIRVHYYNRNAHTIIFELYRLPDNINKNAARDMKLVDKKTVHHEGTYPFHIDDQTVVLKPETYGRYFLYVRLPEDTTQQDVRKLQQWELSSRNIAVSDLRFMSVESLQLDKPENYVVVLDGRTGKPKEGVTVSAVYQSHNGKKQEKTYTTNKFGEAWLRVFGEVADFFYAKVSFSLGKDKYQDEQCVQRHTPIDVRADLICNTNAAIFRPGDTLRCTIIEGLRDKQGGKLLPHNQVSLSLRSSQPYKIVKDTILTLDEMGSAMWSFVFDESMMRGGYSINISSRRGKKDKYLTGFAHAMVRLEDYRLPTFVLSLDETNRELAKQGLTSLTGKALRMTGMPMTNSQVKVHMTASFNDTYELPSDTTMDCLVDADGIFRISLPEVWLNAIRATNERNEIDASHRAFYSIKVEAELLADDGEKQTTSQHIWTYKPSQEQEEYVDPFEQMKGQVYAVVTTRDSILRHTWMEASKWHSLEKLMPKGRDQYLDIIFTQWQPGKMENGTWQNGRWESHTKRIEGKEKTELHIVPNVMRDYLVPGTRETWTFRLLNQDSLPQQGRMMLTMVDQAVQQLAKNKLHALSAPWSAELARVICNNPYDNYLLQQSALPYHTNYMTIPSIWEAYGIYNMEYEEVFNVVNSESDAVEVVGYGAVQKQSFAGSSRVAAMNMVEEEEEAVEEAPAPSPENDAINLAKMQLRDGDTRLALFHGDLRTNEQGEVSLTFDAPSDNTTWDVQAMAWSSNMASAVWQQALTAKRALMLHLTLPRFMRQGDQVDMSCRIQNASAETQQAQLIVEILQEDVEVSRTVRPITLSPQEEKTIAVPYRAGNYTGQLTVRAFVRDANGASDGEKRNIMVYSIVEPIREAEPFFMSFDEEERFVRLPETPKDATGRRVELTFCDNPLQLVLEALPAEADTSVVTVTQVAHNLYTLLTRNYIAKEYPAYAQSVNTDALVRKLARYQTRRGYRWLDESRCEPSSWATMYVLGLLGEIYEQGELPDNLKSQVLLAIRALDEWAIEEEKELKKIAPKAKSKSKLNYGLFASYAHVRAMYHDVKRLEQAEHIYTAALDSLLPQLSSRHLEGWPQTALTLERAGRHADARKIINGLRRYSYTDDRLGMYWNNMPDRWWYYRQADVMATFLMAFQRIDPVVKEIEGIRKWLLLNWQTTDWGKNSLSAYATRVLVVGADPRWIKPAPDAQAVQHIALPDTTTCYLVQKTTDAPAFGALRVWYDAPATSVQPFETQAMRLTRDYYLQGDKTRKYEGKTLPMGQKILVRFTIKTDREMDHVVITDPRPAGLEIEQGRSGYRWQSGGCGWWGTVYYEEVKNSETKLYIYHLPKGETTFEYEAYVTNRGITLAGIADAVCEQADEFVSHTGSTTLIHN